MRSLKWTSRWAAAASVGLTVAATLPAGLAAAAKPVPAGPTIKLIVAQKKIDVPQFGKGRNARVFVDPGVYVGALGSPLQFDVQRAGYGKPITISEIIHLGKHVAEIRPLPAWTINGFHGLNRFIRFTIKNSHGKIVHSKIMPFCPNGGNPQRTGPDGPANSPFPFQCASDPFQLGMVFGLQKDWATDPIGNGFSFFGGQSLKLKLGRYKATVDILSGWRRLLHISPADATATVDVHVVKAKPGCQIFCDNKRPHHQKALPELPATQTLKTPPKADLPDLSPLPSWGIRVSNFQPRKNTKATAQLSFGATVWVGGNSPLDVEGFRHSGSPWMHAFQYFFHNGHVVGRARVGVMGFSSYNHWHFQQFAQYRLLNASKTRVLRSTKVGFCIAPTDPVNLLLPHASWVPSETGLQGACQSQSALWTREELPVGWGDTYFQDTPGQAFDVTKLPNGTYYIEIVANPERLLYETNSRNDISLRKVILGGTPGHRTIRVPALHGIDPER
ncbi:MAG TPA: lysyl oxidase family protein [Streptosporangiaceae bacterium]|nr:lysyl oxidase family protein [Streptosporangiaceae bacterium]